MSFKVDDLATATARLSSFGPQSETLSKAQKFSKSGNNAEVKGKLDALSDN